MFTHIKEDHAGAELSLRYLSVDLEAHVTEYMNRLELFVSSSVLSWSSFVSSSVFPWSSFVSSSVLPWSSFMSSSVLPWSSFLSKVDGRLGGSCDGIYHYYTGLAKLEKKH